MGRYIDADKIELKGIPLYDESLDILIPLSDVRKAIQMTPTADVVEVVRCRDCKQNRDNGGDCDRTIILNEYDSTEYRYAGLEYCSYGERRVNNG